MTDTEILDYLEMRGAFRCRMTNWFDVDICGITLTIKSSNDARRLREKLIAAIEKDKEWLVPVMAADVAEKMLKSS